MIQEEEEVAAVDNLANETEVVENQVKDMPESNSSEYNDKPTLIGQTFVGLYAGIFGWFIFHSLVYFYDLLIPWNLTWIEYFIFYGSFLVTLLLATVVFLIFLSILVFPSCSSSHSMRWPIRLCGSLMPQTFWWSNLAGEPLPRIGSSWLGEDLRYPFFLSNPYFYFKFLFFMNDTAAIFNSDEDGASVTHLFRPFWRSQALKTEIGQYGENLWGILALGYVYFSYLFIIFAGPDSLIELPAAYLSLILARSSFGYAPTFIRDLKSFKFVFVPAFVMVRAYVAYQEWRAHGPIWYLLLNIVFCLSHLLIFAGWYSAPTSVLGKLLQPYTIVIRSTGSEKDE